MILLAPRVGMSLSARRGTAIACSWLAIMTSAALACDTRDVARGVAAFNSCGTPWGWARSSPEEDIYLCASPACDGDTVLRITLDDMGADDAAMSSEQLLADWPNRVIPSEMGDYRIEMAGEIAIRTIGGEEGIFIPLRLTHKDGGAFTSLAFRIPRGDTYVIANATGATDQTVLRGFLSLAVENMQIEAP